MDTRTVPSNSGKRSDRDRVVSFLLLLTSSACRAGLGSRIPEPRVIFELCRLWFDEVYVPGPRYLDGIKGDVSRERINAFLSEFSEDEAAALERFHAFFELRLDMLPERTIRDRTMPASDMWHNIVRDARYLVEDLEPDPERRQALVDWIVLHLASGDSPESLSGQLRFLTT